MSEVSFLTIHARALVCIAQDPEVRLRDIASALNITERSVNDLTTGGYVVKERDGRRNRYHVQVDTPLNQVVGRQETVGDLLKLLVGTPIGRKQLRKAELRSTR